MVYALIWEHPLTIRSILGLSLVIIKKHCFAWIVFVHLIHLSFVVADRFLDERMHLAVLRREDIIWLVVGNFIIKDQKVLGII